MPRVLILPQSSTSQLHTASSTCTASVRGIQAVLCLLLADNRVDVVIWLVSLIRHAALGRLIPLEGHHAGIASQVLALGGGLQVAMRARITPCALGVGQGIVWAGLALPVPLVVELPLATLLAAGSTHLVCHTLGAGGAARNHCKAHTHTHTTRCRQFLTSGTMLVAAGRQE